MLFEVLVPVLGGLGIVGCAESNIPCPHFPQMPADQRGSFMGKIPSAPVNIIADAGLNHSEFNQIQKSVNQWNSLGTRIQGGTFFNVTSQAIPDSIRAADPRDCNSDYGSEKSFYLVKESSNARWSSLQLLPNNPGATIRCGTTSQVRQQIIYINGNDLILPKNQVMSVVLHELGHSLGLDHSCADGAGSENYRGCGGLSSDHPYRQAVMFPILNAAEFKEILMPNDSVRTQCLYGGT